MMEHIKARNANQALPEVMRRLKQVGVVRESRNGKVAKFPGPCCIEYIKPQERVVFWEERNANPFFHLLESLWMLAGRDDVEFPASIVSTMKNFSDDGVTFNGAYGKRWRYWFGKDGYIDQLQTIGGALRSNPDCRRQVLSMWDAHHDLGYASKDLPCNTHAYFAINNGKLDMTICNRSNDIVWGALGANCVHMSFMQEYIAAFAGVSVGRYYQFSNNMHLYLDRHEELMDQMADKTAFNGNNEPQYMSECPYQTGEVLSTSLFLGNDQAAIGRFDSDNSVFISDGPVLGIRDPFIRGVATPLSKALGIYKAQGVDGIREARQVLRNELNKTSDWYLAADQWLERRLK